MIEFVATTCALCVYLELNPHGVTSAFLWDRVLNVQVWLFFSLFKAVCKTLPLHSFYTLFFHFSFFPAQQQWLYLRSKVRSHCSPVMKKAAFLFFWVYELFFDVIDHNTLGCFWMVFYLLMPDLLSPVVFNEDTWPNCASSYLSNFLKKNLLFCVLAS